MKEMKAELKQRIKDSKEYVESAKKDVVRYQGYLKTAEFELSVLERMLQELK